jgi:hypothetical protein
MRNTLPRLASNDLLGTAVSKGLFVAADGTPAEFLANTLDSLNKRIICPFMGDSTFALASPPVN